jgi:hypothetical protein
VVKLVLQRSLTIARPELERVMQAVLFYSDQVLVRATAVARPGDGTVYRRMNELSDMGLLSTWAYEYELAGGRPLHHGEGRLISPSIPAQVVTIETSRDLVNAVDDELSRDRKVPYGGIGLREGVSEVVQLRHSITTLRMTDHLGAHGIVGGHPDRSAVVSQVRQAASSADATEAVVSEVVGRCSFGPLSDLPLRAIEECRREMPRFRDFLEEELTGQATGHPANPHEVAELIMSEYRKVNRRETRRPPAEDSWDVVGMVLPHAVVVKAAGARIEWFKYRGAKRRPFILLGKLQHHAWEAHS